MREIKFRGRNIATGEWVYGCLVNNLWNYSEHHSLHGNSVCEIIVSGEAEDWSTVGDDLVVTVDPKTVGQLTGLPDKYGKDIWEGDIATIVTKGLAWGNEYEWTGIVEFSRGAFVVKSQNGKKTNYTMFHPDRPVQVIGNLFENSELLTH